MNHVSYHVGQFLCACLALITPMLWVRPVVGSLSTACYVDLRSRCPAALRRDSSRAVHLIVRRWIYMSANKTENIRGNRRVSLSLRLDLTRCGVFLPPRAYRVNIFALLSTILPFSVHFDTLKYTISNLLNLYVLGPLSFAERPYLEFASDILRVFCHSKVLSKIGVFVCIRHLFIFQDM